MSRRSIPEARSVEMHLRVETAAEGEYSHVGIVIEFQEGETIWTESSHKYSADEIFQEQPRELDSVDEFQWIDELWPFAENLLIAQ